MREGIRIVDIHSHIIFGVDDGASDESDTRKLLEESYKQGVRTIIATPHRRRGMFETSNEVIKENFARVEEIAREVADDLEVYLGSEVFYREGEIAKIESGNYETLAQTDYILIEFSYEIRYKEMYNALNNILQLGLTPVIAHIERYNNLDEKKAQELVNMGCLVQINAASILKPKLFGDKHKNYKKRAKKYLDAELVHFIASDMHNMTTRRTYMKEAFNIIEKKYGTTYAFELFSKNQERLLMLLLRRIWSQKLIIVLTTLVFTAGALMYSLFIATPKYNSTTRVYVVNQKKDNQAITTQDVQLGTLLVKDYKEIILSNSVMSDVVAKNKLQITPGELAKKISVDAPKDTRIISITVTDKDPQKARDLANAVREVSADKIKEVTKIEDVTTLEQAEAALTPSSPNVFKNSVLAALLGLILAVGGVVLIELMDDRIKRPEDIEETMNLVLLGVIPSTNKK